MQLEETGYRRHLKRLVYALARCYGIRPRNSSDAADVCRVLHSNDLASTLGKLSKSGDDPEQIVHEYQAISNSLKSSTDAGRFYLSLKSPALRFNACCAAAIVSTALQNGHSVHFDAHAFIHADPTLRLLEDMMGKYPAPDESACAWRFGLTLPSRWRRSVADARWAAEKGVRPRLVKGDFRAGSSDEVDPQEGFLALVDQLAGQVAELALATHDRALAREAVIRCKKAGCAVELELFFGRPSKSMMALARELGVAVRFYVPYGDTLLIYLVRDLLTNPQKILTRGSLELLGSQEAKLARIIGSR